MGFRRRTRRRALIAGAAIGHHRATREAEQSRRLPMTTRTKRSRRLPTSTRTGNAPPPADPADELEHLGQLHDSGTLTDEEFAAAKAKIIGS